MNDHEQFEGKTPIGGAANPRAGDTYTSGKYAALARWLQQALGEAPSTTATPLASEGEAQLELLLGSDYHLHFYQQLPDFVMALLSNDSRATLHYAPLLYHLASCRECHQGYLELYDAMGAAVHLQKVRPVLGQGTRTLAATPQRMLGHLCQVLISQAEAVLRQARHDHTHDDDTARSLLQLAIHIGAHIGQSMIRHQALHSLVRVATLFDGPIPPREPDPAVRTYIPALAGSGGARGHKKIVRRAETGAHPANQEPAVILLQSRTLEGSIYQVGQTLELHLHDLDEQLRGHYVTISVPLGSLLEPVRWLGGNPRAIRSSVPVDSSGQLVTPLGQTELQLTNPEDHNLLEVIFMLLEVRPA
ncbi:MAG TPA: hypothetical protein VKR06_16665 [Ktedonosporobacter sp.]|nr:hypothetical protein [Ktedonosporobacter sp.]